MRYTGHRHGIISENWNWSSSHDLYLETDRACSHEPGWPAWSAYRDQFHLLGLCGKFQPGFRDEKRPKTSCGEKFEKQNNHGETQSYNFRPIITLATLIVVMWCLWYGKDNRRSKMMQNSMIRKINPAFLPVTEMKCSYGKIFSLLTEIPVRKTKISGTEPARPLIRTHRKFYKRFRCKRDLQNRAHVKMP